MSNTAATKTAKVDRLYQQLGWSRQPSIAEMKARMAELERELEIAKAREEARS